MATTDISRAAFDTRKHYTSVRMQQGRVTVDDDWNENERIEAEDLRRSRVDIIGPDGSPDDGFLITNLAPTPADPTAPIDFDIEAGTFYLGGRRLELEASQPFRTQADWLQGPDDPHPAPGDERFDLAYLETYEVPVEAVEDSELFEVALGGPDTSTRIRTIQRVRLWEDVGQDDCADAWQAVQDAWAVDGLGTLNEENELVPDVTLTVTFDPDGVPDDLCTPLAAGGYLGAENQAIRVQLVDADHFTWGFDNASPLYRVQAAADRQTLTLLTPPKDQAHWPLSGQIVEILSWAAVLPNNEKVAEIQGHLTSVDASYNPDTGELTLQDAIPVDDGVPPEFDAWTARPDAGDLAASGEYYYMRVWNRGADRTSDPAIAFVPGVPVALEHTGLNVTIDGADRNAGDYWIIAARPETPNQVVPWNLETGRRPHGIRRFYAPLALVHWQFAAGVLDAAVVEDCRRRFQPLTRLGTCCTYRVGDGTHSHGNYASIQDAINALPVAGGHICILPGRYEENVLIDGRANITLSGCGVRSRITSVPPGGGAEAAPVIHIRNSQNIHVESLAVVAHETGIGVLLEDITFVEPGALALLREVTLADLHVRAAERSAIAVQGGQFITIRGCRLEMQDTAGDWPGLFFVGQDALIERNVLRVRPDEGQANIAGSLVQASAGLGGLQLGGTSERVRVINNLIQGGIGNGITLGTVETVDANGNFIMIIGWVVNIGDPCSPCKPGDTFIPPQDVDDDDAPPSLRSAGPLYEIYIARNRILDMGLNGIGVVGFFNLDDADEFISVNRLTITGNEIRRCLQRSLAETLPEMIDSMGYGGIALADVEYLVVRNNVIEDNGPSQLEPICGVFVLHGEGIDISGNRILNNGARTASTDGAKAGRRGGINIVYAVAPTDFIPIAGMEDELPRQNGVPAAKVHDNIVSVPLGQALSLTALGPVSVVGNQFTSRGVLVDLTSSSFWAATVAIFNLGLSNELGLQLLGFSGARSSGKFGFSNTSAVKGLEITDDEVVLAREGLDDLLVGQYLANGNVLFSNNQCTLDLLEPGVGLSLTSILIVTLDDVGFHNNQCDSSLLDDFVLSQAILFGFFSVRASDNRFKETLAHALFSAVTLGLMNTTTDNQGTHCFVVLGVLPKVEYPWFVVDQRNTELLDGLIRSVTDDFSWCNRLKGLLGGGSGGEPID